MYKNQYINSLYQNTLWHLQQHSPVFAWIESPMPKKDLVKDNQEFLVLHINKTCIEKAISIHTEDGIFIQVKEILNLSLIKNHIELFEIILHQLKPDINVISINLSLKIQPILREYKLDGKFIKEKPDFLKSLSDNLFGLELENYIYTKRHKKVKVVIAHDTTCLTLAGYQEIINPEAVVSCIIDYGTNFAFLYNNTTINLESGHFHDFDIPKNTLIIDDDSQYKNGYLFEKSVSGEYLYLHYNIEAKKLNLPEILDSKELSILSSKNDSSTESKLAQNIIQMSAELIGAQIAAMHVFYGKSLLHIIIKGYLFQDVFNYKIIVENTLESFNVPIHKIDWITVEEDALLGSAWLVKKF